MENLDIQGRKSELRQLLKLVNQAKSGQSKSLLLTGDAGIGKSALLSTFSTLARKELYCRVIEVQHYALSSPEHFFLGVLDQFLQDADKILDDALVAINDLTVTLEIKWEKQDLIRAVSLLQLHDTTGAGSQASAQLQLVKSIKSQLSFTKKLKFSTNDTIKKLVDLIVHPWVIVAASLLTPSHPLLRETFEYAQALRKTLEKGTQSSTSSTTLQLTTTDNQTTPDSPLQSIDELALSSDELPKQPLPSPSVTTETSAASPMVKHLVAFMRFINQRINHLDSAVLIVVDEWDRIRQADSTATIKQFVAEWISILNEHKSDHTMVVLAARTEGESYTLAGALYNQFRVKMLLEPLSDRCCQYLLKKELYETHAHIEEPVHQKVFQLSQGNPFWHLKMASCIKERINSSPVARLDLAFFDKLGIDDLDGLLELLFTRLKLHFLTSENKLYKVIAALIKSFQHEPFSTTNAIQEISLSQNLDESYVFEVLRVLYRYNFLILVQPSSPHDTARKTDPLYSLQSRFIVEFLEAKTRFIETDISTDDKLMYLKKVIPLSIKSGDLDREKTMEVLSLAKAIGNDDIIDFLATVFKEAYNEEKPVVRVNAVNNLALIDSPETRDVLYLAMKDSSSMVREYAAKNLSIFSDRVKDTETVNTVIQCMLHASDDESESVRSEVYRTLFKYRFSRDLTQVFIKGMSDASHAVRLSSLQGLADADSQSGFVLNALLDASTDAHAEIRRYACIGLQRFDAPEAIDSITKMMQGDPDPSIRAIAAEALNDTGDPEAFSTIVNTLKTDVSEDVKISIVRTLGKRQNYQSEETLQQLLQSIQVEEMPALAWTLIRSLSNIAITQKTLDFLKSLNHHVSNNIIQSSLTLAIRIIQARLTSDSDSSPFSHDKPAETRQDSFHPAPPDADEANTVDVFPSDSEFIEEDDVLSTDLDALSVEDLEVEAYNNPSTDKEHLEEENLNPSFNDEKTHHPPLLESHPQTAQLGTEDCYTPDETKDNSLVEPEQEEPDYPIGNDDSPQSHNRLAEKPEERYSHASFLQEVEALNIVPPPARSVMTVARRKMTTTPKNQASERFDIPFEH